MLAVKDLYSIQKHTHSVFYTDVCISEFYSKAHSQCILHRCLHLYSIQKHTHSVFYTDVCTCTLFKRHTHSVFYTDVCTCTLFKDTLTVYSVFYTDYCISEFYALAHTHGPHTHT